MVAPIGIPRSGHQIAAWDNSAPGKGEDERDERGDEQTAPAGISADRESEGEGGRKLRHAADRARRLMSVAQDGRRARCVHRVPDKPEAGETGDDEQEDDRPTARWRDAGPQQCEPSEIDAMPRAPNAIDCSAPHGPTA